MRSAILTTSLCLATLAACAPAMTPEQWQAKLESGWTKPDAKPGEVHADYVACDYEAAKATAPGALVSMNSAMAAGWAQGDLQDKCMEVRGWRRAKNP